MWLKEVIVLESYGTLSSQMVPICAIYNLASEQHVLQLNCLLVCLLCCSVIIFIFIIGLATSKHMVWKPCPGRPSIFGLLTVSSSVFEHMHIIPCSQTQAALGFMVFLNPKHIDILWQREPHKSACHHQELITNMCLPLLRPPLWAELPPGYGSLLKEEATIRWITVWLKC